MVLTDYFTCWQDALPIPDATMPTVATIQLFQTSKQITLRPEKSVPLSVNDGIVCSLASRLDIHYMLPPASKWNSRVKK